MMWPEPELRAIIRPEPELKNRSLHSTNQYRYIYIASEQYTYTVEIIYHYQSRANL